LLRHSVKGHKTCHACEEDTSFLKLKYGRKTIYLGTQIFLLTLHCYRRL